MVALRLFLLAGLACCLAGCGTFTRGFSQEIAITTDPPGANVSLTDGQTCVAPCKLSVKRVSSLKIKATKSDCRDVTQELPTSFPETGTALLSFIDYQTGSAAEHQPNPVMITLSCGSTGTVELNPFPDQSLSLLQSSVNELDPTMSPADEALFAKRTGRQVIKPAPFEP